MLTISHSAEARLVETLNDIREVASGWTCIVFNLSGLLEEYKSEYQVKIAVNLINDLLKNFEGGIYMFADGSIAVLCNQLSDVLQGKLIFQLRYLYMDDPLAYHSDGQENPAFCAIFHLRHEWRECADYCTRRMMQVGKKQEKEDGNAPVTLARMAAVERTLDKLDITEALRRQPVCAITFSGAIKRVFDEIYINMAQLRQMLKTDVDLSSNKWLFKYITQLLDQKVLGMIGADAAKHLAQPVSININVEALLSDWFAEFNAALGASYKVSVVFEVQVVDVFADVSAFNVARETAQKAGYRICIDGLTTESFLHIDRTRLKADLVKLQWNADLSSDLDAPENRELAEAVTRCGANRIILCRCDSKAAIEYGQALRISLFQGRHLDGLINPLSKVQN